MENPHMTRINSIQTLGSNMEANDQTNINDIVRTHWTLVVQLAKGKQPTNDTIVDCFRLIVEFQKHLGNPKIPRLMIQLLLLMSMVDDARRIAEEFEVGNEIFEKTFINHEDVHLHFGSEPPEVSYSPEVHTLSDIVSKTVLSVVPGSTELEMKYIHPNMTFMLPYISIKDCLGVLVFRCPFKTFYQSYGFASNSVAFFISHINDLEKMEKEIELFRGNEKLLSIWFHAKQDTYRHSLKTFRKTHNAAIEIDKNTALIMYRKKLVWNLSHIPEPTK